jgi:zinc protease
MRWDRSSVSPVSSVVNGRGEGFEMKIRCARRWILGLALLVMAAVRAPAAQQPSAASGAAGDIPRLAFEKYTLPNGLVVILSGDKRLPMVAVNLWYHVGPANEEAGRTGFAHLFEHMMFQGSKHVPPDTYFKFLESAGASDINGTTDFDRTNYFETLPSNQLELALWLESDRMGYLLDKLDEPQLANQQDVVRNERRQSIENRPYGLADDAVTQMLFPAGHPYYANVMGSHQDIQAARLTDVKTFFKQYYAPNNASLAIVGDFDRTQAKALVAKYFGTLKRGPSVPPIKTVTPRVTQERRKVVTDRVELPRIYVTWITSPIFKPGDAEADIAATILGGGKSSRLYKRLVYEQQIAQNVSAQQYSLMLGSMFQIEVTARPGHTADELEKALDEELDRFRASAPDVAEVDRARNTIETRIIERLETLGGFGGVADRLNMYNHFLGTPDYLQKDVQRYRAVSPASVRAFASDQLKSSARVIVQAVPGEKLLGPQVPTPPAAQAKAGEGAESVNVDEPWRNNPPKAGPARPLQLGTPDLAQLANGLTVILSPRRGLPVVAANLVVRTGSDANPLDKPGLASFTAAMLNEGTTARNAFQIADQLAQFGATLGTRSTMDATFVQGESLKNNFGHTLELMADVALHPSFPDDEIERQRSSRLAQLVQQRENAGQLAANVTASALYGDRHPYGFTEIGTEAAVRGVSRTDMEAFWKQNFVPNNAALVVAGDITMSELKPLAESAFRAWPPGTPAKPVLGNPETTTARLILVDKPGAPQTEVRVVGIGAPRSSADFQALQVMNMALGGLFSSRINMNLREEHGYTYGASSQFVFRRSAGPFVTGAGVRTDVTAPAVTEILKEVRGIAERPMNPDELRLAKDALARSLPGAFETSSNAAGSFSNVYIYDLGLDYFTRYPARVDSVTADQAQAVAQKYLVPGTLIVIAVGDRAKIEPELRKLNLGTVEARAPDGSKVAAP